MKVLNEIVGKDSPLIDRLYIPITYCLNCDDPIHNNDTHIKEYCGSDCQNEHDQVMRYVLEEI